MGKARTLAALPRSVLVAMWIVGCWLAAVSTVQANPRAAYRESGEGFRVGVKVRVLDLADGSARRLVEDWVQEDTPSWGPNGDTLAASADRERSRDIFRARIGGSRTWLTEHPAWDTAPAWSQDGGRIAFVSYRDRPNTADIYVMDADGGDLRRLTDGPWHSNEPAWSPDGERLAYAAGNGEGASILRVLDVTTGVDTALTEDDASRRSPAWSWDGMFLAYESHVPDVRGYHIRVRTLDGRDDWSVTESTRGLNSSPAWTPSGNLSFLMLGQQRHNIGVVDSRGGDIEMLTNTSTYKEHLTWYNPRYFPVRAVSILQPHMWGWLKRP